MGLFGDWFSSSKPDEETLEKINVLNQVKLFENARREDLAEVAQQCEFRSMEPEETIVHEGDPGDGMFIVDEGLVSVRLSEDETVASFGAGEYFGEMALLENAVRSADVVCEEPGRLLFFSEEGFHEVLRGKPSTASKFMFVLCRTLSRRLRDTNQQLREQKEGD
jgi:CRP/FNR family cyclic AMP-dependent transcriptional regulator